MHHEIILQNLASCSYPLNPECALKCKYNMETWQSTPKRRCNLQLNCIVNKIHVWLMEIVNLCFEFAINTWWNTHFPFKPDHGVTWQGVVMVFQRCANSGQGTGFSLLTFCAGYAESNISRKPVIVFIVFWHTRNAIIYHKPLKQIWQTITKCGKTTTTKRGPPTRTDAPWYFQTYL